MARYRSFWRICYGWCLLCCVLPTVEAGTKAVNVPSISQQVEKGTASLANGILTMSSAIEGEYIPAPTKNVPVRGILGGTEFGLNTIKAGTKGLIKGGVAGIVAGAAIDQLMKGLDWVMADGTVVKKSPGGPVSTSPANGEYSWYLTRPDGQISGSDPGTVCSKYFALGTDIQRTPGYFADEGQYVCGGLGSTSAFRQGNHCPDNSAYSSTSGACMAAAGTTTALSDQDFIDMDTWINNQDAPYLQNLLKQQCVGSLNPNACYAGLRKAQLDLRGPKTVDAGTTTTKSTHANSDGTTSTTTTTTNNKYDITYGPSSLTYNKSSTTTTSTDGKPGDTTTTTDEPSDEADPDDSDDDSEDKATPSPCSGAGCDGPKYDKLYEPTKDTKEKALDSYASRVKALPIVASVAGFFTVNASAGCPSWSTNVSFAVFASMFSYDLVFDFYCQPWFVSMAQYAKIVFSIVCAYLAFRQAILD